MQTSQAKGNWIHGAIFLTNGLGMMTWVLVETAISRGFGALQALYYLTGAARIVLVFVHHRFRAVICFECL